MCNNTEIIHFSTMAMMLLINGLCTMMWFYLEGKSCIFPGAPARTRRARLQPPGGAESIPLDLTPVKAKADDFLAQLENLAQSLYTCSSHKLDEDMRLQFLKNDSVTCNDGSPAGYYIRESKSSKRWLLLLEGGWYCFSKHSCDYRMKTTRALMSSSPWPQTRKGTGILSPKPEENPYWWNANMVFLPYCSSDLWSGTKPKTEDSGYAFMGSLIIKEVVNELLSKGLDKAKVLLLAGISAGGVGVLVNVDRVEEQLRSQGHQGVQVRGLSDSGWILQTEQYKQGDCTHVLSCGPNDMVKIGFRYWGAAVPEVCRQSYIGAEWNCFFGPIIYPTIKSPTFVVRWLFDQAQMTISNVDMTGGVITEGQWNYIAVFAPACLAHELITRTYWMSVQVGGTSLPKALHCWERSLQDKNGSVRSCPLHLVDHCLWLNCNPTCPDIYDQPTGREMNAIQFLKQMGLKELKISKRQG
uniref:Notum, palmitoleoyl-protein carboxylesterase n=1 Tax=Takifugu rubripes TaxID=31033 RepID=H2U3J2_TAKRU